MAGRRELSSGTTSKSDNCHAEWRFHRPARRISADFGNTSAHKQLSFFSWIILFSYSIYIFSNLHFNTHIVRPAVRRAARRRKCATSLAHRESDHLHLFFVCLGIKSEINQQRSHESHQESYTRVSGKSNWKNHFFTFCQQSL